MPRITLFHKKRREEDSNLRTLTGHPLSRRTQSTTLPSLLSFPKGRSPRTKPFYTTSPCRPSLDRFPILSSYTPSRRTFLYKAHYFSRHKPSPWGRRRPA